MTPCRFLWKQADTDFTNGKPTKVKVFKWTGKNDYVALCLPDSISFGGGYVSVCSRSTLRYSDTYKETGNTACSWIQTFWMDPRHLALHLITTFCARTLRMAREQPGLSALVWRSGELHDDMPAAEYFHMLNPRSLGLTWRYISQSHSVAFQVSSTTSDCQCAWKSCLPDGIEQRD